MEQKLHGHQAAKRKIFTHEVDTKIVSMKFLFQARLRFCVCVSGGKSLAVMLVNCANVSEKWKIILLGVRWKRRAIDFIWRFPSFVYVCEGNYISI